MQRTSLLLGPSDLNFPRAEMSDNQLSFLVIVRISTHSSFVALKRVV